MKKCRICGEEFEDKYGFCPVDGSAITTPHQTTGHRDFNLTIINDASLLRRLLNVLHFSLDQFKLAWPLIKRDPTGFALHKLIDGRELAGRILRRPYVLSGSLTALVLICTVILSILLLERHQSGLALSENSQDEFADVVILNLQNSTPTNSDPGVGANGKGRVGFNTGTGEGSNPTPARAHGGGGGGMRDPLPPSTGRLPFPSVIPAPIPTTYARLPKSLPEAGIDIDPALYRKLDFTSYGDPRSKSTTPSNGAGDGGGVGTNNGQGIGEGDGTGFGPGRRRNSGGGDDSPGSGGSGASRGNNPNGEPDRVYKSTEVTTRARVLSKIEPQYTEEARRNQITGTVILSVVFSRSGQVTNIRAVQPLCCGLTEKAIGAARLIRFVPATRNGDAVSMYMQLEYNFNLY
jgi:TonB family protein